jgi:hypothetical protein
MTFSSVFTKKVVKFFKMEKSDKKRQAVQLAV